jgi:hypothetical protein
MPMDPRLAPGNTSALRPAMDCGNAAAIAAAAEGPACVPAARNVCNVGSVCAAAAKCIIAADAALGQQSLAVQTVSSLQSGGPETREASAQGPRAGGKGAASSRMSEHGAARNTSVAMSSLTCWSACMCAQGNEGRQQALKHPLLLCNSQHGSGN